MEFEEKLLINCVFIGSNQYICILLEREKRLMTLTLTYVYTCKQGSSVVLLVKESVTNVEV